MTDALRPTVPAGWYPDPWGSASQRWWDGAAWTDRLDPAPASVFPDAGGRPEQTASPITGATDQAGESSVGYEPAMTRSTYEPAAAQSAYQAAAASAASASNVSPAYQSAPAPSVPTYPSRRALRQLAATTGTIPVVGADFVMPEAAPPAAEEPSFTEPPPADEEPAAQAEDRAAPVSPAPVLPVQSDDAWAASLSNWDALDTSTAAPDALPIFGDAPPVSYSQRATKYKPLHGRTSAVWLMVFIPVLHGVALFGSLFLFRGLLPFDGELWAHIPDLVAARDWLLFAVAPLGIAFFGFTLVLGFQDRARLRLLGHDSTASPWWIVLHPFVYLIVRSIRVTQCTGRRGSGPLTTYTCLYIAPPIAVAIAIVVVGALNNAIPT